MIDPADWLLSLFLIAFILSLLIGIEEDSPPFFILSGIAGIFLALAAYSTTASIALTIVLAGLSLLILAVGIRELAEGITGSD